MGYDPSYQPPERWFCGQPHLRIARDALKQAAVAEKPGLHEFGLLFQARLEMKRGMKAILGVPLHGDWPSEELKRVCKELPDWLVKELSAVWGRGFAVHYGGNNQYGVPNYYFKKDGVEASLTGSGDQTIIREAFNERLVAAHEWMRLVIRAFGEIYVKEKAYDLFYNDPFEDYTDEESFQKLQRMGAIKSAEETSRRFDGSFGESMKDPEIAEAVRKWRIEYGLNYHNDSFWSFEEHGAICYAHSS